MPGRLSVKVGAPTGGSPSAEPAAWGRAGCVCVHWSPPAHLPGWPRLLLYPHSFVEHTNNSIHEQMLSPVRRLLPWGAGPEAAPADRQSRGETAWLTCVPSPAPGPLICRQGPPGSQSSAKAPPPTFDQPRNPHPHSCQLVLTVGGPSPRGGGVPPSPGWTWAQGRGTPLTLPQVPRLLISALQGYL